MLRGANCVLTLRLEQGGAAVPVTLLMTAGLSFHFLSLTGKKSNIVNPG